MKLTVTFDVKEKSLYAACENRFIEVIELLLSQPKIDFTVLVDRKTCLHLVCENNDIEILKMLLPHEGLDFEIIFNPRNPESWEISLSNDIRFRHTPLSLACEQGHLDIVKLLKENEKGNFNAIIEKFCGGGFSEYGVFTIACFSGSVELVQYLLSLPDVDKFPKVKLFLLFYFVA